MKYLYAAHTYGWGVRKLSYYITLMGGLKALFLLLLLPCEQIYMSLRNPGFLNKFDSYYCNI